jgi:hypothetical protein
LRKVVPVVVPARPPPDEELELLPVALDAFACTFALVFGAKRLRPESDGFGAVAETCMVPPKGS